MNTIKQSDFRSFAEFYPYYLQEHGNPTCRRLHFVGTRSTASLAILSCSRISSPAGLTGKARHALTKCIHIKVRRLRKSSERPIGRSYR